MRQRVAFSRLSACLAATPPVSSRVFPLVTDVVTDVVTDGARIGPDLRLGEHYPCFHNFSLRFGWPFELASGFFFLFEMWNNMLAEHTERIHGFFVRCWANGAQEEYLLDPHCFVVLDEPNAIVWRSDAE